MDDGRLSSPFKYEKWITDALDVVRKKIEVVVKYAEGRRRTQVSNYISGELNSSQEFFPLVAQYVYIVRCQPLHMKNKVLDVICFTSIKYQF